jgi:uncharacterized repeat protein (TIGR03803 family)
MTTLLAFDGTGTASPAATLLANKTGGFNGTSAGGAYGKGNVFTLAPPIHAKGTWHATTLYSFTGKADGAFPHCRLISGADGSLWGTTPIGGAGVYTGVVFRLTPPAKGKVKWRYQVLYRFRGGHDGSQPYPGLVFDPQGAAYGVTWSGGLYNAGTIFQVKQTAPGVWSESILYNFGGGADSNPNSALLRDHAGNLYGTASGVSQSYETGELFKLIPPAQAGYGWGFSVLHHFSGADGGDPGGDLLAGPGNALIGTTYYGGQSDTGTVYRFAP